MVQMKGTPRPSKVLLQVRINSSAREWIDGLAERYALGRPDVTRALLAVASLHPREVEARLKALADPTAK